MPRAMPLLLSRLRGVALAAYEALAGGAAAAAPILPYDGPDLISDLNDDAKHAILLRLAPADVARLCCTSKGWRAFLQAHEDALCDVRLRRLLAAWPSLAPPPAFAAASGSADSATRKLRALAVAQLQANKRSAAEHCTVMHASEHGWRSPYWDKRAAAGSSPFDTVAHCANVCWFDVDGAMELQPGAYLLRWRVHTTCIAPEPLTLSAALQPRAGGCDTGAPLLLTPVPWPEPEELEAALMGAQSPRRRVVPRPAPPLEQSAGSSSASELQALWAVNREGPLAHRSWRWLPVAVAFVEQPATLHFRLWKHTGTWVQNLAVDYFEAVPLGPAAPSGELAAAPPSCATSNVVPALRVTHAGPWRAELLEG